MNKQQIKYYEKDGKIEFSCEKLLPHDVGSMHSFIISDVVPDETQKLGVEAIRKYAENLVERKFSEEKTLVLDKIRFLQNPDFSIETEYDGKRLKGRITMVRGPMLTVRLEYPYKGVSSVTGGRSDVFVGNTTAFTEGAILAAEKLLIDLYERGKYEEKNKEIFDSVEKLNGGKRYSESGKFGLMDILSQIK